ncbi:predicted protein [Lichtheimia corymbifera JMRC:FSU:9682]|uniref:Heterokaryon incompatibility domain-containing protein n=1 Tax=Lichtheimia corymbifera JMRC:FSU:9682 TaxID=1263082 RepID=A0A068S2Q4_9FUNG|nr:predicted protein [Lichtheimia corymbifera JMRC:FSU:9682]
MAWKEDEYKDPFNDGGEFLRKELSGKWVGYDPYDDVYSDSNNTAITQVDESTRRKRRRQNRSNDCPSNNGVHSYFKGNDFIIEDGEGNRKILYNYDPYKNNLILEDDEDNMKALYNLDPYRRSTYNALKMTKITHNPNFLLVYVPENGAKMQIVRLSSDLYHRKRVIKRINEAKRIPSFYYALSHLWGLSENNRHLWYEIGDYVDDESGKPVEPVSMRPEKRDTLLALLKDHPDSYWWIDILCARTGTQDINTPLDIMGDIYACCLECISMIDCDPNLIRQLNTMKDLRNLLPAEGKNGITSLTELLLFKQPYDKAFSS